MHEAGESGDRLYGDPELARFYDLDNDWGADLDYCARLAADARSVLDLGCGTGRLAAALAGTRFVAGVHPAAAMLAIARQQPGGHRVDWIEADARDVRLGRRFDLVLLTGHAFQVFLTHEDQLAVLRTIAAHLAPHGRFIFDTRNPDREEWREWTPQRSRRLLEHPRYGTVKAWNDAVRDETSGIVTYETHYQVVASGRTVSAKSKLAFTAKDALAAMLAEAGLHVDEWLGDWLGHTHGQASPEIIPVGCPR